MQLEARMTVIVTCGATYYQCRCVNTAGHDGPHECDHGCGGAWIHEAGGIRVLRWPSGIPGAGLPNA